MAIGTGWEDGAWIDAGWASGAWSASLGAAVMAGQPAVASTAATTGALVSSAALQIDGTPIPVVHGTHAAEGRRLVESVPSHGGEWLSGRTYTPGRNVAGIWGQPLEIPATPVATAESYEDVLKPHGQRAASGYLVGGTVQVYVRDMERVWGDIATEFGIRFVLLEAEP